MTITDILPYTDNKHSFSCYQCEKELKDQVTCLQKSVANLRKDLSIQMNLDKSRRI